MTDCESILEMHAKCWDYLINIQKSDNTFYFVPRKINNAHRLEQGYFFIGNEKYMQISFWNGGDTYEKIHNISWGVEDNGQCFIEVSSKDNTEKASYLGELVGVLEKKTGTVYRDLRKGKWRYDYPKSLFYLDALRGFINREKPIIDEYIKSRPSAGILMLDKDFNKQYVLKHLYQKKITSSQSRAKKKQEGTISVSPSSYLMALHHNELQNAMVEYLKAQSDYTSVDTEVGNVDISAKTASGEKIFYELKTSDVKQAIRLALGQLLEYCHYHDKTCADKLIIVTKYAPSDNEITYIKTLRKLYQMPVYYQQFDMHKKELSDLY